MTDRRAHIFFGAGGIADDVIDRGAKCLSKKHLENFKLIGAEEFSDQIRPALLNRRAYISDEIPSFAGSEDVLVLSRPKFLSEGKPSNLQTDFSKHDLKLRRLLDVFSPMNITCHFAVQDHCSYLMNRKTKNFPIDILGGSSWFPIVSFLKNAASNYINAEVKVWDLSQDNDDVLYFLASIFACSVDTFMSDKSISSRVEQKPKFWVRQERRAEDLGWDLLDLDIAFERDVQRLDFAVDAE